MNENNKNSSPQCSKQYESTPKPERDQEKDEVSIVSKEITSQTLDNCPINPDEKCPMMKITSNIVNNIKNFSRPLIPITDQPLRIFSNLPSPASLNVPTSDQPQSLFLQALSKLNESSISLALSKNEVNSPISLNIQNVSENPVSTTISPEITPPNSLTSAPPSYSFVLRQMTARRPRLMGTFIPSPSFIQHTPPPNYATAFDIYVDNPIPPPPVRPYNFGFTPMLTVCPQCGFTGMTVVATKITICTHLCAITLCLLCCWICAPLPYVLRSCKDVYHYCRNCRSFLGMYCPTNPESVYP